jgi:phytoene dehydrogenase-like protein
MTRPPDAAVVGGGPNGLAAALILLQAGLAVDVYEGAPVIGGGCRTEQLTMPGFLHDVCASGHPLAASSPFLRGLGKLKRPYRLLTPPVAMAHPLDGGRAVCVGGSVAQTAAGLGADGRSYQRLMSPLVRNAEEIVATFMRPLRSVPRHPFKVIPFGLEGLLPASVLGRSLRTEEGKAWLAGVAAHSTAPLSRPLTGAYGLWFTILAHAYGWPVVEGGSAELTKALAAEIVSRGGRVETGRWVRHIADLPSAQVVLLDVSPAQLITMAGSRLPARYVQALRRFHYGPGVCKVDWALAGPVPWQAASCRSAGTVHLGGPMTEIAASESDVAHGRHPDRPFSIIVQAGVIDSSRAPQGKQALYGYCHVPNGSTRNMANQIEAQIERFAPGFRDLILARSVRTAVDDHIIPQACAHVIPQVLAYVCFT